ncbi:hypothetical protein [Cupriavidus sp. SW-Y-13]|uniref:hypothetical protein n=1 Tax=Cupriavidus sp. SW-Y-13 TaxID=2653854 RepID=UPI00136613E0|nr:hypothetical protein [Cupriavidus sp. SW-Y-13]MWL90173.1 hypothetical protein [Cupriavidus sp. SW-Y-13]
MQTWKTLAVVAALGVSASAWGANEGTTQGSCAEVEVNGERAPAYDCLTQRLAPASSPRAGKPGVLGSEAIANQPSNQLGLYNRAATSTRMGNTFGASVLPQRPPPSNGVAPIIPPQAPR